MADEPKPRRARDLSARDIRFCQLHVERGRGHAVACYLEAGFEPRTTPSRTNKAANYLLRKPAVREYLRALRRHAAEIARTTLAEVVAAVRAVALTDRRALFDERGGIRPPHEWPADLAAAVDRLETTELFEPDPGAEGEKQLKGYARKVKFADRLAALVKLVEFAGLGPRKAESLPPGKRNAAVLELVIGPETVPLPREMMNDE